MTMVHTTDWSAQGRFDFASAISEAMKQLFEVKHLYQSIAVDVPTVEKWKKNISDGDRRFYDQEIRRAAENGWEVVEPALPGVSSTQKLSRDGVHLSFPTIKLFCDRCDSTEAHNISHAIDITGHMAARRGINPSSASQHFVAVYTCQACKAMLQHFIVRRDALRLCLVGRSPIEHVAVPDVFPRAQRKYYSGAIVAFQSGQTLPALFMLRTFIEQFAASQVSDRSLRADAVLDAYMAALPEPVRAHFASPREIYSKLSEAIHTAREDTDLFNASCEQLVQHFDARRLYKVTTA